MKRAILLCGLASFVWLGGMKWAIAVAEIPWVVSAKEGALWIRRGALVLDVRGKSAWLRLHVRGSVCVEWLDFSRKRKPWRGELASVRRLVRSFEQIGISKQRVVIVVGDPLRGWGEEGRIVWMLRSLGHRRVAFVDGGMPFLRASLGKEAWEGGKPTHKRPQRAKPLPTKRSERTSWQTVKRWSISTKVLRERLVAHLAGKEKLQIVDVREPREFRGETPYGESRGGHLPKAVSLYYRRFLRKDGRLRSRKELLRIMQGHGLSLRQPIVAYCTGGVRSAWMVAVLHVLGAKEVKNYAGSMWAWSAGDPKVFPLRKSR
ncbi:MAG: sulfurtransferase [Myxococcales bacterium]|nr:sulfurtransferase [Myxococcales bacterium]